MKRQVLCPVGGSRLNMKVIPRSHFGPVNCTPSESEYYFLKANLEVRKLFMNFKNKVQINVETLVTKKIKSGYFRS